MLLYLQMLETPEEKSLFEQIYLEYRGLMYTVHEMDHGVLTEKEHISSECLDHNLKN